MKKTTMITGAVLLLLTTRVFSNECNLKWCKSTNLSTVEKTICGDNTLKAADILMSHLYTDLMSYKGKEGYEGMWYREVQSNQKDWITDRNKLKTRSQLIGSYLSRTQELHSVFQNIVRK